MINPWKSLETPEVDLKRIMVDPNHPLDFYWAKDHKADYLFLYEYPSESEIILDNVPELKGIETSSNIHEDRARLIVALKEKDDWEIFHHLCTNLIQSTNQVEDPKKASTIVLNRLKRWHKFLQKEKSGILREEQIKGLIGELIFLKNWVIPKYGVNESIKFWVGPEDMPQDFTVNNVAVEVKCQLGSTRPQVKISSQDQLHTQLHQLILYVVTLGKATSDAKDAINLPGIIKEVETILDQSSSSMLTRFQDLLFEAGYFYHDKYLDFNYLFAGEQAFIVKDGFPRIISKDLAEGISNLSYTISLSDCREYKIDVERWEEEH
tara:strand:+ start:3101 stop:4066 length:966 start_codon:yes stop_codon:yes gene_type:complete